MRYPGSLSGLLALGAFLAGCADRHTVDPDLRAVPLHLANAASGQVVQSARGSGHLTVAGELRTFTFNAEKRADGSVTGEVQIIARQVDRVSHGRVTCMNVLGSSAWIGVVVEEDNVVPTPFEGVFRVVDLGQAPGGSPDLLSLLQPVGPGRAQVYCNAMPSAPPLNLTQAGEIVITQPGSMSFTSSAVIPIDIGVFVPCALNGAGEVVLLSGDLHVLFHFTDDGAGGFHVMSEANPQGISGTGLTSGDKYQGTGVTRQNFNSGAPLPFNSTFVNNFRIIGEG
jgi:hypothetical protein